MVEIVFFISLTSIFIFMYIRRFWLRRHARNRHLYGRYEFKLKLIVNLHKYR